ncbi:MAG: nucleotidyltransferase domain-containing protein, partial [Planctomycetaceae bacterium]|nr:nucleotidyltransferase domain-containing protein [Planctomycetaceae bacterium]
MNPSISDALRDIERKHDCRVLHACESGSRAWGFPSPDSDYDIRFIYVHRRNWYLRLNESRDTHEWFAPGDLDFSGWELRKALRLFRTCNLSLNEHLQSPIIYEKDDDFAAR